MNAQVVFWLKKINLLIPFLWGVFCVLLNYLPCSFLPAYHQSFPIVLIFIFYFSVFAPHHLGILAVFLLGLIDDFLSTAPFGMHAFIFSLFFFVSNLIRTYIFRLPFLQLWLVFAVLFLLIDIVWSWLFKMASGMWVSASFWFVQYLIVCLIYPFFMWLTGHVNQRIKEEG